MTTKKKIWIGAVLCIVVLVAALAGVKAMQIGSMIKAGKAFVPPPEAVTSARVEASQWEASRSAIGTLVAVRGVTLGSELPGLVREITFESGSSVRKGQVLVRLDISAEEAQLSAAEADASLAKLNLERARTLRQGEANTQADLDAAQARARQTQATVANLEAVIAKKTIKAPFDGRISIRQVELGQVLQAGTPIASLQSVSPIHADFYLPQQALAEVKAGQRTRLRTDAFPGASWEGEVTVVNPEVDVATRNVRIRATFANGDGRLRPGMFANVEVLSREKRPALVIPATSVLFAPYGDSVFVIEEKKDDSGKASTVARQKFVRLGERRGDFVAVAEGLSAGETIVSSGAFKLRNGMAVVVNNALAPDAKLAPKPAEN
ncbi:MAG TPA: efflux RND transporter periplasmic adaptor subunit [Anaeromyxobacteraceae bacterium]|nr:efflux RND transporter periplasmic adaptor subunit [Anaeromyxobacteraceae bacterium]